MMNRISWRALDARKALEPWRGWDAGSDRYNMRAREKRRVLPHALFFLTFLASVAMGVAAYRTSWQAQEASAWVDHTHEVLAAVAAIGTHVARTASSVRGYVLSENPGFLMERDAALTALTDTIDRAKHLVIDSPEQRARILSIEDLVSRRAALIDELIARHEAGADSRVPDLNRRAHELGRQIEAVAWDMEQTERRLFQARRAEEDRRYRSTLLLLLGACAMVVCIFIPAYALFLLQSRARARIEQRLYEIADSIPGVVYQYCSTAGGGHYEFVGRGVESLYGVSPEAALRDASSIGDRVVEEDRAPLAHAVGEAARALTPLHHEFRIRTPHGEVKWLRSAAAPSPLGDDRIVWNGHWADVTEQKRIEQALHDARIAADEANRAKSSFLAVMSHEIRTPLNGILGMLELLSLTGLDREQRTTVNVVRESGRSLQRIIDDILDFSKIEAGRLDISPEPASLSRAVESARNMYAGNASSKGLLLTCCVDPQIGQAHLFDPLRLRQIINNLVSNAIKFTSSGTITIRASLLDRRDERETVRISVTDTGIGISREVQARLFEPFTQASAGTARTFGGSGLGLAISRRLVRMMNGTLEMESEPGRGTTMTVTLELSRTDAAALPDMDMEPGRGAAELAPARAAPTVEEAVQDRTLILIADDHPTNRMLLVRQVNTLGYAAEVAGDGRQAFEQFISGRYGAVISDVNMPGMDGYQLARAIRAHERDHRLACTPIIACTANALKGEADACLEAGMDDYLAKPVQLSQLQRKLAQWLPLHTARAARAPSSDAESTTGFLDRSSLAELTGGVREEEADILSQFAQANARDSHALRDALRRGEMLEARRTAHRIKGASRMVGLTALAAACEALEARAQHAALADLSHEMARFEQEVARAHRYVESLCTAGAT